MIDWIRRMLLRPRPSDPDLVRARVVRAETGRKVQPVTDEAKRVSSGIIADFHRFDKALRRRQIPHPPRQT